ncbi:uncharacterized protein [Rhodnius prolixus]|uniref:uncharacterized protein n=1 Tax=Rhodnius prolixus TaxID=13249 RepID=UPI003D189A12
MFRIMLDRVPKELQMIYKSGNSLRKSSIGDSQKMCSLISYASLNPANRRFIINMCHHIIANFDWQRPFLYRQTVSWEIMVLVPYGCCCFWSEVLFIYKSLTSFRILSKSGELLTQAFQKNQNHWLLNPSLCIAMIRIIDSSYRQRSTSASQSR